jgi:hypothetical protein
MTESARALPTFICVGPGRAGTSWLYEVFLEHPEVCMAKGIKETQFFNENFNKGLGWYEAFFEGCGGARAKGEISNLYIFDPRVAERIKATVPDCKILICMRNPYERIQSVYSFKLREGALGCSFEEALKRMPELIERSRYYSLMKPFYEAFGKERIFPVFFEDIARRPLGLCRELFRFLGVDEDAVPSVIGKKVNRAIVPRFPLAAMTTKGVARLMRRMGLYWPLTRAKRSDTLKGIFFKAYDYKKEVMIGPSERALIDPVVLPELDKLEALLGRPLTGWRPVGSGKPRG